MKNLLSHLHSIRSLALLAVTLLVVTACSDEVISSADPDIAGVTDDGGVGLDSGSNNFPDAQITDDTNSVEDERRPRDGGEEWTWDTGLDPDDSTLELTGVIPPTGPIAGGTRVQIRGEGLTADVRVFFGSREVTVRESSGHLVGDTPPSTAPGPVTVKIIDSSGASRDLPGGFTYLQHISVDSVVPNRVPTTGGVEVTLRGAGFAPQMGVTFSGRPAPRVNVLDSTMARVIVPANPRGMAELRVTTASESVFKADAVEYYDPIDIQNVQPTSGPLEGGQTVTLRGRGLTSTTQIFFGVQQAQTLSVDAAAGTIRVRTPAHAEGLVHIVAENANDSHIVENAYLYYSGEDTILAAAHPSFGPTSGGTDVWLVGAGFDVPGFSVTFGSATAETLESSANHARVRSPAGSLGAVDIALHSQNQEIARLENAFDYRTSLTIDDVLPAQGPSEGGTQVTLTGDGFSNVERVSFGTLNAQFEVVSDSQILAITPPHTGGSVDVTVERNGLQARVTDGFRFVEALHIWGFSPVRGAIAGGTYVALRGTGFYGLLGVNVGGEEASGVRRVDNHNLYFYTPPHPAGEANIVVTASEQHASAPYPFAYFNPVNSFGGASGSQIHGAVNVTVLAMGGAPVPGAFVMLSTRADTMYQDVANANGQVTLSGPDVLGAQTVTAAANGFSTTTIQAVDAENITVFLNPVTIEDGGGGGGTGEPTPFGTISGIVTARGKNETHRDPLDFNMAVVRTTRTQRQGSGMPPGPGSTVPLGDRYEIRSRVGDVAVIALCGTFHHAENVFTAEYMAVERYLVVSNRSNHEIDLECDIPLDESITVKLVNPAYAPTGPDNNRVQVFWDFGFEGIFSSPTNAQGLSNLLSVPGQPALEGPLADMTFTIVGGSYTGGFAPYTQTFREHIADISRIIDLEPLLPVAQLLSPEPGGVVEDNIIRLRVNGPYYPDFFSVVLRNSMGLPIWQFLVPGDQEIIRIPDFPDFSHLPFSQRPAPLFPGPLYATTYGVRIPGFSFDNISYRDLSADRWSAFSVTTWVMRFYSF